MCVPLRRSISVWLVPSHCMRKAQKGSTKQTQRDRDKERQRQRQRETETETEREHKRFRKRERERHREDRDRYWQTGRKRLGVSADAASNGGNRDMENVQIMSSSNGNKEGIMRA